MVKRYFIWLSYDGTNYHGWQVQPNGISVQGELQRVLSTLLRQEIDKGVQPKGCLRESKN